MYIDGQYNDEDIRYLKFCSQYKTDRQKLQDYILSIKSPENIYLNDSSADDIRISIDGMYRKFVKDSMELIDKLGTFQDDERKIMEAYEKLKGHARYK